MTDWRRLVVPGVAELDALDVEATVALRGPEEVLRLDWNENHFGPLPGVLDAAAAALDDATRYSVDAYGSFRGEVAAHVGVDPRHVAPGSGTQALIGTVASALLRPGDSVVAPAATFYLYALVAAARGATMHRAPLRGYSLDVDALVAKAREVGARIVWVCDPNNPTGTALSRAEWEKLLAGLPEGCVAVADEAYADFLPPDRRLGRERDVVEGRPAIVLRTFSKLYGLPGLRLGYAIADPVVVSALGVLDEAFNVSCTALAAGRAALASSDAVEERRREVAEARELLAARLLQVGVEPLPSEASFVLARVDADDVALARELAARGVLVRAGSELGLPGHLRITVAPPPLVERLAAALEPALAAVRG